MSSNPTVDFKMVTFPKKIERILFKYCKIWIFFLNRWRYFIYHVLYITLNSTDVPYHLRRISIKCFVRWLLYVSSTHVLHKRNMLTSFNNSFSSRLFYTSPWSLSIKKIGLLLVLHNLLLKRPLFHAFIPLYIVEIT